MKKGTLAISLLAVMIIFSSCQKIKDLLIVKVDADFTVNLPVVIPEPLLKSATSEFLTTDTFDPLDDEDLADYKEKIEGYELTGLTGRVSDLSAPVTLTNTKLVVTTGTLTAEWNFTSLPLTNGTVVTFDNTGGQWTKINEILGEQKVITVTLSGSSSQSNVTFNLELTFETEVSTKVL